MRGSILWRDILNLYAGSVIFDLYKRRSPPNSSLRTTEGDGLGLLR